MAAGEENCLSRRVLVVEDETLISMMVEDMLDELGYTIVGPANNLKQALAVAAEAEIDVAIIDVNLNGEHSGPVADVLAQRRIPFVFASGYGVGGLPEAHRGAVTLCKPYEERELARVLAECLRV